MRAPEIERAVVDLEARIRSAHPEVTALFVKPQSVQAPGGPSDPVADG